MGTKIVPDENGWMSKFPTDFGVPRDDDLPYSIVCPPRPEHWSEEANQAHRFNFATLDECGEALAEILASWAAGGLSCECGEEDCHASWVRVMPVPEVKDNIPHFALLKSFVTGTLPAIIAMIAAKRGEDPETLWERCQEIEREYVAEMAIAYPREMSSEGIVEEAERILTTAFAVKPEAPDDPPEPEFRM